MLPSIFPVRVTKELKLIEKGLNPLYALALSCDQASTQQHLCWTAVFKIVIKTPNVAITFNEFHLFQRLQHPDVFPAAHPDSASHKYTVFLFSQPHGSLMWTQLCPVWTVPYTLWPLWISRDQLLGWGLSSFHGKTCRFSRSQGRPRASPSLQKWTWALWKDVLFTYLSVTLIK